MKKQSAVVETQVMSDTRDLNYAIGLNRRLMAFTGVWPLNRNPSALMKITRIIRLVITCTMLSATLIPQYAYLLTNPGMRKCLEVVAQDLLGLLALTKYAILVLHSDEFGCWISDIKKDWENVRSFEDRKTMIWYGRLGRYMTFCCYGWTYSGVIFYSVVVPFLKDPPVKIMGNTSIVERPIPFEATYIFFDESLTPAYEITWFIQCIGVTYMCFLNCASNTLIGVLVAHACGQLRIIGSRMENLVGEDSEEIDSIQRRIAEMIQHHVRVIRYITSVNQSFQMIFYAEEFGTLTTNCFLGYLMLLHFNEDSSFVSAGILFVIMTGVTFNFFIISIVGQQLWDESEAVNVAISRVRWYRLPPKVARSLICMVRATRPLKLTAYNMFDMSLANFGDVVRGAFIFLNMVRQVAGMD